MEIRKDSTNVRWCIPISVDHFFFFFAIGDKKTVESTGRYVEGPSALATV